jgi:hypothetical protein
VVREALSAAIAKVVAAAVVEALLLGGTMPPAEDARSLPTDAASRLADYRRCEASFKSGLASPPGASAEELAIYRRRIGIERAVACAFRERDAARIAAGFAFDLDFDREAEFIDSLMSDLPVRWIAPYLNLTAGHAKICRGRHDEGRRQLMAARDGGNPLIRVAADYLIATADPPCSPAP